jgi:hypothetical protein
MTGSSCSRERHPLNAPGDFYVEHGCCTSCDVPLDVAPDIFAYDQDRHCFVRRQPASADETFRVVRVLREQDLGCIRYGGTDAVLLQRIAETGEGANCDSAPAIDIAPRDIVRIRVAETRRRTATELADDFVAWLRTQESEVRKYSVVGPASDGAGTVILEFAWFTGHLHRLRWSADGAGHVVLEYLGGTHEYVFNVTNVIYDWLSARALSSTARWFTRPEWSRTAEGSERPW